MVLGDIIFFFVGVMAQVFVVLDSNYIDSYSVLDIFIAIIFFEKTVHFIIKIITTNQDSGQKWGSSTQDQRDLAKMKKSKSYNNKTGSPAQFER